MDHPAALPETAIVHKLIDSKTVDQGEKIVYEDDLMGMRLSDGRAAVIERKNRAGCGWTLNSPREEGTMDAK